MRRMKKLALISALLLCVGLGACSKDSEVSSFLQEFETVTNEMIQKIEAGDIDGAKKAFKAKEDSLKTSWDSNKSARGFQVSAETKTKMEESVKKNISALTSATMKSAMKLGGDKAKAEAMQNLLKEFVGIFKM